MIKKRLLYKILRELGGDMKKEYKKRWNKTNPTHGNCYVVTEFIKRYLCQEAKTFLLKVDNENN